VLSSFIAPIRVINSMEINPFYFKSYDRVIGEARDVNELAKEMKRLAREDPAAVGYHNEIQASPCCSWLDILLQGFRLFFLPNSALQ
jgi:hypothetical protein